MTLTGMLRRLTALTAVLTTLASATLPGVAGSFAQLLSVPAAHAAVGIYKPISYQGKLTLSTGTAPSNGQYNVRFKIFTGATLGSPVWTETWNGSNKVSMTGGLFSVQLGSLTAMTGSVNFNSDNLYLQTEFDPANAGTYPEVFSPRRRFTAVPYALNSNLLNGLSGTQFVRSDTGSTITAGALHILSAGTSLTVSGTASGDVLHAERLLTTSGAIVVRGAATFQSSGVFTGNLTTKGTLSGAALTVMGGTNYLMGNVGIGTASPAGIMDVYATQGDPNTNIIPEMTSYTNPSGTASANSEYIGYAAYAWRAFQSQSYSGYTGSDTGWVSNGDGVPAWLQYQFPSSRVVTKYVVTSPASEVNRTPSSWSFQGSNNGSSWTTLDTRSGVTWASANLSKTYTFANGMSYTYYRLSITATSGDGYIRIGRLAMYESASSKTSAFVVSTTGQVGFNYVSPSAQVHIQPNAATMKGIIVQAAAFQSANLQEWQNNAGTALALLNPNGALALGRNTTKAMLTVSGSGAFTGTLSGSALNIQGGTSYLLGNVGIGKTTPAAKLDVVGTISGSTLTVSSLQTCAALQTSSAGALSCASGLAQTALDNRYVNAAGDTMTGALVLVNGGHSAATAQANVLLEITGTASGTTLHAENTLTSSGTLKILGTGSLLGNTIVGSNSSNTVTFNAYVSSNFIPYAGGSSSYNLGSTANRWNILYANTGNFSGDVDPSAGGTYNLGTSSQRWSYIYGNVGNFSGNVSMATAQLNNVTTCGQLGTDSSGFVYCNSGSASSGGFGTGNVLTVGDARYVKKAGDTMTGALVLVNGGHSAVSAQANVLLEITGTASGTTMHAESTLTSSGVLIVRKNAGTATGKILIVDTKGFVYDATNKRVGIDKAAPGTTLDVVGTVSGSVLYASSGLSTSGALVVKGAGLVQGNFSTRGTLSGAGLTVMGGNSYLLGNVGIGTTSPGQKLDINGNVNLSNGTSNTIFYGINGVAGPGSNSAGEKIQLYGTAGTVSSSDYALGIESGTLWLNTGSAFKWYINSVAKMFMDAAGNLGIGTTAPATALQVVGDIRTGISGTNGCVQNFAGTAIAGTCSSDERLKQNITPIGGTLAGLRALTPVTYTWRQDVLPGRHYGTGTNIGLTAQDVEKVFPELVSTDKDGYKTLNYTALPIYTIKAVQELGAQVQQLQSGSTLTARTLLSLSGSLQVIGQATFGSGMTVRSHAAHSGTTLFSASSNVGGADNTVFRVTADGNAYSDGTFTGGGADYAEWFYASNPDLRPGEAVCIDVTRQNTVARCSRSGDPNVMGIVSTRPAFIGNKFTGAEGLKVPGTVLVGLIGQVPAKAVVENGSGAIRSGDQLTTASKPGYVRKARAGESTVGVALENLLSSEGRIHVLISRRNQSLTVDMVEEKTLQAIKDMKVEDQVNTLVADAEKSLAGSGVAIQVALDAKLGALDLRGKILAVLREMSGSFVQAPVRAAGTAPAGTSATLAIRDTLTVGGKTVLSGAVKTGTLTADALVSNKTLLVAGDTSIGGDLYLGGMLKVSSLFVPGIMKVDGALDVGSLTAGSGSVKQLAVDRLTAGSGSRVTGTLVIDGRLQVGSGAISFATGSTLDVGRLTAKGALNVMGDLTIKGLASFLGDVRVQGELIVSNRQAGLAVVPKGSTGVTVAFGGVFPVQPVVTATPNDFVITPWRVTAMTATGFRLEVSSPATEDLHFSWTALGVDAPLIAPVPQSSVSSLSAASASSSLLLFPVDAQGVPLTGDVIEDGCLRNQVPLDADGHPYTCARYHTDHTWQYGVATFEWNTLVDPPRLTPPAGYAVVRQATSSSVSSENSVAAGSGSTATGGTVNASPSSSPAARENGGAASPASRTAAATGSLHSSDDPAPSFSSSTPTASASALQSSSASDSSSSTALAATAQSSSPAPAPADNGPASSASSSAA